MEAPEVQYPACLASRGREERKMLQWKKRTFGRGARDPRQPRCRFWELGLGPFHLGLVGPAL